MKLYLRTQWWIEEIFSKEKLKKWAYGCIAIFVRLYFLFFISVYVQGYVLI